MPTLLGQQQNPNEYLYWEFYSPFQQAVRIDNWKGIRLGTKEEIYLFDLKTDLKEENNLAARHPVIVARIAEIMEQAHEPTVLWPVLEKTEKKRLKFLVNKSSVMQRIITYLLFLSLFSCNGIKELVTNVLSRGNELPFRFRKDGGKMKLLNTK